MANFTMELRKAIELYPDGVGLNNYPIFDEHYRVLLNQKIVDKFFFREIGQETVQMFAHYMNSAMCQIMPLYNKFYKSEQLRIDPLLTMSIKSLSKQLNTAENESTSTNVSDATNSSKSRAVESTTPQHMLSNYGDYASGATDAISATSSNGEATDTSKVNASGNSESENTTTGLSGNQSDMLMKYRDTFLNIDQDIINEIDRRGLFMNIFTTGDDPFLKENNYGFPRNPFY